MNECNSVECNSGDLTYYQRTRDVILSRAKDYYEMIKKDQESKQEINTETYRKKKKRKRENMEKADIAICLKKNIKNKRISKKYCKVKKSQYNNE